MRKKQLNFHSALQSFLGHLEGTDKALATISNYRLDVLAFHDFLAKNKGKNRAFELGSITQKDLLAFDSAMKSQGLKTNTRRRKLLTLRKFLNYLSRRNKIALDMSRLAVAPYKVEKIPETVDWSDLRAAIIKLPVNTPLLARNRLLLWTLLETGCLVSEVSKLKYENFSEAGIELYGKASRKVPISSELWKATQTLQSPSGVLFQGFNRHGPLSTAVTPRGVELLVKSYAEKLGLSKHSSEKITPRTFRHSTVKYWFKQGLAVEEIQRRLGLKSTYAFRALRSNLQLSSKTTSTE